MCLLPRMRPRRRGRGLCRGLRRHRRLRSTCTLTRWSTRGHEGRRGGWTSAMCLPRTMRPRHTRPRCLECKDSCHQRCHRRSRCTRRRWRMTPGRRGSDSWSLMTKYPLRRMKRERTRPRFGGRFHRESRRRSRCSPKRSRTIRPLCLEKMSSPKAWWNSKNPASPRELAEWKREKV